MLKLEHITKDYVSGGTTVQALKGIDIEFRKNEFVSILGQSGCGKTTLLNIIGGLDRYTDGNLIINGKSTKEFKDKDWDAYRNYSVGFVFQSYNLIPHQTVLSNVELALTISGVSRKERKERAIKALKEVGLGEQIHKKPNQLSGGQMQRVAIARALVNDPDIILADEPTGALDTKTSVQIMDILKKISKDKLIIMVTHNPELAEKYSSRVVKILDGVITDDSNPYNSKEDKHEKAKTGRTSMKFFTALRLSLNNLMTKKGRTLLTSFAGSIGIIGIALILAISTGVNNYIQKVEEDTLSSYPITIEQSTIDVSSMMESMMGEHETDTSNYEEGKIYSADIMNEMIETLSNKKESNNLTTLKEYLEQENNEITNNSNAIKYNYDLSLNLYKEDTTEGIVQVNPSTVMNSMGMGDMIEARDNSSIASMLGSSSMMMSNTDVWTELLDNEELLHSQYDIVAGSWPKAYNEVVLIVNENNELMDYTLYSLGLKDQKELKEKWEAIEKGEQVVAECLSIDDDGKVHTAGDLANYLGEELNIEELMKSNDLEKGRLKGVSEKVAKVEKDEQNNNKEEKTQEIDEDLQEQGQNLGLINVREIKDIQNIKERMPEVFGDSDEHAQGYSQKLGRFVMLERVSNGGKSQWQLNEKVQPSQPTRRKIISIDEKGENIEKSEQTSYTYDDILNLSFKLLLNSDYYQKENGLWIDKSDDDAYMKEKIKNAEEIKVVGIVKQNDQTVATNIQDMIGYTKELKEYVINKSNESEIVKEQKEDKETNVFSGLKFPTEEESGAFDYNALSNEQKMAMRKLSSEKIAEMMETYAANKAASYEKNLEKLGAINLEEPSSIAIYPKDFDSKDAITKAIEEYNQKQRDEGKEENVITYTDMVGIMMKSVSQIINTISYVLIAFVAISLIVSSIMIGIITYISVLERIKEIGILRAIGASKKDISRVFNAETFIVGFISGILGIGITILLTIPINRAIYAVTGVAVHAMVPPVAGIILVLISMILTMIAGLIPAKIASKKDPVEALRTE